MHDKNHGKKFGSGKRKTSEHVATHPAKQRRREKAAERLAKGCPIENTASYRRRMEEL